MNDIIKKVYNKIKQFKVADIGQVRPKFKNKAVKGMTFIGFYRIPLLMLLTKISGHALSNIRAVKNKHKQDLVSIIEGGQWREGNYIPPTVVISKSGQIVLTTGEHTFQAFYDNKSNDLFVAVVEFDTFDNIKIWQSNENANLEYVKRGRDDDQVTQTTKEVLQRRIRKGLIDKSNIDEMENCILEILKAQDITKSLVGEAKVGRLVNQVLQYYNDDIEVVKSFSDEEFKEYFEKTFKDKTLSNGKFILNDDNSIIIKNKISPDKSGMSILRYNQKFLDLGMYLKKMNFPLNKVSLEIINEFYTANSKTYKELVKEDKSNTRLKEYFSEIENILKFKDFFLKAEKHNLPQLPTKEGK